MRNINFPLLLGSIILILLILVASFPGLFTTKDPLFEEQVNYIEYEKDGELVREMAFRPMRPNKENIFGTDDAGRDVYARLVYGARNTLKIALLIAVFRITLALVFGLAGGMGMKFISGIIKIFNIFFTAIPMLLFSFVVLNIGYFRTMQLDDSILAFAIVLTFVGWAKPAGRIEDETRRILAEDFIEGEVAIGKSKLQIAYQNVLPHIIPTSVSMFFKEIAMGLFLIAQLAVLYVFVGVTRQIKGPDFKANYLMILEPEWGGTLSRIAVNIRKYHNVYWITLYPILVFSIAIIGFNLAGEGLRIEFLKRESRWISSIRKAYYKVSPMVFLSQIKNIRKYYKPVIIKTLVVLMIIAYFVIPWHPSLYEFDLDQAKMHLEELTKDKYGGRVAGTEGGYLAGEYIIDTLKSYGYQVDTIDIPLVINQRTIPQPDLLAPMVIESGWIKLKDKNGEEKTYNLHKDFTIASLGQTVFTNEPTEKLYFRGVATEPDNKCNIPENMEYFAIEREFNGFTHNFYSYYMNGTMRRLDCEIQFILDKRYNTNKNTYLYTLTTIFPFDDLRMELESGYKEMEICFDYPKIPKHNARLITAFLPGKDKTKEEPGKLIIMGASYDGVYANEGENPYVITATSAATALEVARTLSLTEEPLEKSIQFVFWDNEFEEIIHSPLKSSEHYLRVEQIPVEMTWSHKYYYFDIGYSSFNNEKHIKFMSFSAQRGDKSNYLMVLEMQKRLSQIKVPFQRYHYNHGISRALKNMKNNSLTSVSLGSHEVEGMNSDYDTMENINIKMMKNIGQALVDTLTMNPYIKE